MEQFVATITNNESYLPEMLNWFDVRLILLNKFIVNIYVFFFFNVT